MRTWVGRSSRSASLTAPSAEGGVSRLGVGVIAGALLLATLRSQGISVRVLRRRKRARYDAALAESDGAILAYGSLYLASELRRAAARLLG